MKNAVKGGKKRGRGRPAALSIPKVSSLARQGLTRSEIAQETGAAYNTVCSFVALHGIHVVQAKTGKKDGHTQKIMLKLWLMEQTGEGTMASIAKQMGLERSTVWNVKQMVKAEGIKL